MLGEDSQEISHEFLSLGVIQHLLYAMGNREHTDAQVQASLALKVCTVYMHAIFTHIDMHAGIRLLSKDSHMTDI